MRTSAEAFRDALVEWLRTRGIWSEDYLFSTKSEWAVDCKKPLPEGPEMVMGFEGTKLFMALISDAAAETAKALDSFAEKHGYFGKIWPYWCVNFYPLEERRTGFAEALDGIGPPIRVL